MMGPKKNPRDSRHTMLEMVAMSYVERMWVSRWEITASVAAGSRKIGKISAKSWPCISVRLGAEEGSDRFLLGLGDFDRA